jgi:nucleotide-binding universal stress UspA family protein
VHGAGVEGGRFASARRAVLAAHAEEALARATAAARGKLELLVEDPLFAGRPVDEYLRVRTESGAEALLATVRERAADLLVLGAHRVRRPFDLGGTARAVLAHSSCPVWVEPADGRRFERVLAPIDLSPAAELVLRSAHAIAARFTVPVRVLHVFTEPGLALPRETGAPLVPAGAVARLRDEEHAAVRALVERFDWGALPVEAEFADGDPAKVIVERSGDADLVVMGTHGHTGLSRAVLGSCAYGVLRHGSGPMLVVPAHAERA